MMQALLTVEAMKLRRSLALLVTLACPLMVVLLLFAVTLKQMPANGMKPAQWGNLWAGVSALWCYFMLPLYVALITTLVNGSEHRNQTWRLMLTLPVGRGELFAAKALVAWGLVAAANAMLVLGMLAALGILFGMGYPTAGMLQAAPLLAIASIPFACIPVLVIQHAASWRMNSVVPPLAIGVVATMGIVQLGSSKYWLYYPWSYPLVASNGGMQGHREHALSLALGVGAALFALSAAWLTRREDAC